MISKRWIVASLRLKATISDPNTNKIKSKGRYSARVSIFEVIALTDSRSRTLRSGFMLYAVKKTTATPQVVVIHSAIDKISLLLLMRPQPVLDAADCSLFISLR